MDELGFRILSSGVFAVVFFFLVSSRHEPAHDDKPKYLPYVSGLILPLALATILVLSLLDGPKQAARTLISFCFGIFPHISFYFLVLLLFLPFLRKHICARTCALLWMIPNYLYIMQYGSSKLPAPKLVITAPGNLGSLLFLIWALGVVIVLTWKMIEHHTFRREILRDCIPISDPKTLSIWQAVIDDARVPNPIFKLVMSHHVHTPLTIGLWRSTTVVVLPDRIYTPDELKLIFRHEIIHISREDAWSKSFLVFCTAMCWFNPLMWIAMKKSSEDLELSCDESVLLDTDAETHKKYALLLLDNTGDPRGFTTCLAASLQAMRYRLKRITQPTVQRSGALLVGLTVFFLFMTNGYISLAYNETSGAEIFSPHGTPEQYFFSPKEKNLSAADLIDDLSKLTFYEMTGNYSFFDFEEIANYSLTTPEGFLFLNLYDHAMTFSLHTRNGRVFAQYYVPDGFPATFSALS